LDLSGKSTIVVIPVIVDNNAPTCRLDNPTDAEFVSGDLVFKVSAADAVGIDSVYLNLRNLDTTSTVFNITMTYGVTSGYYEHAVATGIIGDGNYLVSAWSKDLSGKLTAGVPVAFKIDNNAPTLLLTAPAPGAYVSGDVAVLATVADTFLDSTQYNIDGGAWVSMSTPWNTLLASEGAHIITVRALDMSGKSTTSAVSVIVDNIAPTCRIDAPVSAQFISGGLLFKVSAADAVGIAGVYLEMLSLDASSTAFNVSMTYNSASGYYEYTYATTMIVDGNYRASAWSKDLSGRWTAAIPVAFKIDNNAPSLAMTGPAPDAYVYGSIPVLATVTDTFLDKTQYNVDGGAWVSIDTPWNTMLVPGGVHTITVRASDLSGKSTTQTISVIVDNSLPTITLVSPMTTDKLHGNVTVKVYVEPGQGLRSVRGGLVGKEAEIPKGFDGLYTIEINTKALGISDGNLAITFHTQNLADKTDSLALNFKVDNKAPTMTVVSGTKGNLLITASFAAGDNVTSAYVRVDGGNWLEMSKVDAQTFTYRWPTKESNNGQHSIEVKATDDMGNEARQTSTIKVDNKKSYSYLLLPILIIILIAVLAAVLLLLLFRKRSPPAKDDGPAATKAGEKNGKKPGQKNRPAKDEPEDENEDSPAEDEEEPKASPHAKPSKRPRV
jgi:hypothetical protein